ncbi:MAG: beta-ketoacyl-[acyl-carrier-protein] synthase family protein [Gammaproteobacteria bacterium]
MTRTYLHALGIINALGSGAQMVRTGLYAGSVSGIVAREDLAPERSVNVAAVREELPVIPLELAAYNSHNNRLLQAAVDQIRPQIDAAANRFGPARIGIVLGTGTSGILEGEQARKRRQEQGAFPREYDYRQQEISSPSEYLRLALGVTGPAYTVSTACTSSAKVFASARRLLRMNACDAVIVGGADSLCRLTFAGFTALESITKRICNPMSRNRDGITLGEGGAVLLMSREPGPACLLGAGESSDAYHISGPDPEGRGAEIAMRAALADAGIKADDVGYLNLHGTGTIQNDLVESHAVARVFPAELPCSSTKPLVGHMLGAAGVTELAFCWLALTDGAAGTRLPPHIWDGERDPALAPLQLCGQDAVAPNCHIMASNSFAFGGSNTTLILGS